MGFSRLDVNIKQFFKKGNGHNRKLNDRRVRADVSKYPRGHTEIVRDCMIGKKGRMSVELSSKRKNT